MTSTPTLAETLGHLKACHPNAISCRPTKAQVVPFLYRLVVTCMWYCFNDLHKGLLPPLDPCLQFTWVDFWVFSFFDSKQMFSPVHHLAYFKAVAFSLESKLLLCLEDLIVTLPYSLVTITNPFQLCLWPEATLSDAARDPNFPLVLFWGRLMATSSVSEHMRQSSVTDFRPESGALSSESLLESESSPLWSASSQLTSTAESLLWSMVLPTASATNLSSGSVATLTGQEGRLRNSGSGWPELWLATSKMGRVLNLLLTLPSLVPAQALLLLWPSGVLLGE